ncbi:hypothetical protein P154DRAFT_616441 [Amniculicola lignicola CBS 123094]|uniref:Mannosyl-oligosaccharide glucosidase n=1 Tax=Amniculicola lignicola CBS 123094 TaxID=1392246 RepID=A0A6A5WVN9_9PLEO|nr:hypothetical protein P154DRAFT_616441 [Amniculicola lignicola CBS 123094]
MVLIENQEYLCEEEKRLKQDRERTHYWKRWGPYVSERQWATVREDYSHDGDAWSHFTHDMARSRAFRWGEDGIAGVSDSHGFQNIAFSFWNEKDDFLKERLFGLSNPQGNHGESIKECHFHLDNTPSHSYMKYLYKYPQRKFPYEDVIKENGKRTRLEKEYNLVDTGIFDDDRYWDIFIETAKEADDPDELLFRVTAYNRGPEAAPLHIVPHMWFRNTWAWGHEDPSLKPLIRKIGPTTAHSKHHKLGERYFQLSPSPGIGSSGQDVQPELLFTENDTNYKELWGVENKSGPYVKDGIHRRIVDEKLNTVNPDGVGTKSAAWYAFDEDDGVPPGECAVVRFRLSKRYEGFLDEELFDDIMEQRRAEADEFYWRISPLPMADDLRNIQRQALSGMLWCKQYYHFIWDQWANGDPGMPPPPPGRKAIRNKEWKHMYLDDILSMPDSWEYPFFAAWDSAFHCIPLAMIDPDFAKKQLDLFTREWYMHPNGQLPAYEWNFGDVNPPVHAWAVFRVFKIERKMYGREDFDFLERVCHKLFLNFTWWVNRKDADGKNIFEGGFLGLDNIGIFNRSDPLPTGGVLEQADSTGWMGFYCLNMLNICLELAKRRRVYEDMASKYFEHFIMISDAMQYRTGGEAKPLWNEEDGFYYDAISWGGPWSHQMPVRSLVGLIPLYATCTLEPEVINKFPDFKRRLEWFVTHRSDVAARNMASMKKRGQDDRLLLALVSEDRLKRILCRMLDESEFLAEHGIRSLSRYHKDHPYSMNVNGQKFEVAYLPGDSDSGLFGGNSNWRGPIWIAVNFLLIESLQRFYLFYGKDFQVECPTGSGDYMHLGHVAEELQHRLQHLMARGEDGKRAINDGNEMLDYDPNWKDYMWYHEFFDGDTGRGLGATHQCGWTGLMAKMIHDTGMTCRLPQTPRTPGSAAAHYFDDIFTTKGRPKKPQYHRRSSTARSIGHRSDWETSTNGDDELQSPIQRSNSIGYLSEDAIKRKTEVDRHTANYVTDQLERLRSHQSDSFDADEFETSLDGVAERPTNGSESKENGTSSYFSKGSKK